MRCSSDLQICRSSKHDLYRRKGTKPTKWCQSSWNRLNIYKVSSICDFTLVSAVIGSRDCEIFKPIDFPQFINLGNDVDLNRLIECTTYVNLQIQKSILWLIMLKDQ